MRPLLTNPAPKNMRGSKKSGTMARAVGKFETRQVNAMPMAMPQHAPILMRLAALIVQIQSLQLTVHDHSKADQAM
jgi:hypothetical protein